MRSPPVFTGEIPEKFHVLLADGTSTGPCEVWAQAPACGQLEHPGGPERCHSQAFVHGISWYRIPCRVRTIRRSFWHGGIRANSKRHLGTLWFWCSSLFYCQCGLYKTIPKRTGWLMLVQNLRCCKSQKLEFSAPCQDPKWASKIWGFCIYISTTSFFSDLGCYPLLSQVLSPISKSRKHILCPSSGFMYFTPEKKHRVLFFRLWL